MKFGAAFLISLATAQDYGLDGADVNTAAFDSDYNYDEKETPSSSITVDDLSSLLADYYGSETDYSIDDYNSALDELQSQLGTTAAAFTTEAFDFGGDSGRPDADYDGTSGQGDEGKLFQNFQTTGNLEAQNLVLAQQTYCWVCDASGADSATTLAACANAGSSKDCLEQGEGDYCQVQIREVNGVIKQIQSRCAQADTCDSIDNFQDPTAARPTRNDRCIPQTWVGNNWGNTRRMAGRESVCSICHYTTTNYASDPTATLDNGTQYPNLLISGSDIKITGSTAGKTQTLTHADFDQEWGSQTNNVLDTVS
jgi:hypothetical protein